MLYKRSRVQSEPMIIKTYKGLLDSNIWIYITALFLIFIMIAARKYTDLTIPYLWAEDANIFLQRSIDYGFPSIWQPYAGYLLVLPQLLTWFFYKVCVLLGLGIGLVPYLMNYVTILLESLMLCYFVTKVFNWYLPNQRHRIYLILFTIFLVPNYTSEVWHNITNIQWWFGVFIFIVGLEALHTKAISKSIFMNTLLILIGLSTLLLVFLILVYGYIFIYNYIKEKRLSTVIDQHKTELLLASIIAVSFLIQLVVYLSSERNNQLNISDLPDKIYYVIVLMFGRITAMVRTNFVFQNQILNILTGIVFWLLLLCLSQRKQVVAYAICFCLFNYCLLVIPTDLESLESIVKFWGGGRYFFAPQMVTIFVLMTCVYDVFTTFRFKLVQYCCISFCFLFGLNGVFLFSFPIVNPEFTDYYKYASSYFDEKSENRLAVPTAMLHFDLQMPFSLGTEQMGTTPEWNLESIDGQQPYESISIQGDMVTITGWAADMHNQCAPEMVILGIQGQYIACRPIDRPDVSSYLQNESYLRSGFTALVPKTLFNPGENNWEIFVITRENKSYNKIQASFTVSELQ